MHSLSAYLPLGILLLDPNGRPIIMHPGPTSEQTLGSLAFDAGVACFLILLVRLFLPRLRSAKGVETELSYGCRALAGASLGLLALGVAGTFFG